MHKIKLILLLILPLSVLGQDLGIIDTKTTKNPAINGTHRISTDGKNLFFRNFFGLSRKVANTDSAVFTNGIKVNSGVNNVEIDQTQIMFRRTNGTTMTLGNYRAYSHQFFTNASFSGLTQAMSINNYGQVIVGNQILDGISNPTVKFQVGATGEARQRIISQASNATIELNGATGGNISNTTGNLNYTSAGNHVFNSKVILPDSTSIGNISSTELTYLDGVTSPIQTQLNNKAPITSPTFITDATTPRLKITGAGDIGKGSDLVMAGNSNDLTMHGTGKVILGTGGFQRLVVTNAGNVGVGTTAPVAKFEVSGLAGFRYNDGKQADGKYLRSNSTGVAAWDSVKVSEVFGLNTTYLPISNPTATGTLTAPIISNSLGATFATTSGNVGIGTTTPTSKLSVSGSVGINTVAQSLILNNATGVYSTYQYNGTSVGDIGTSNQAITGGGTNDFAFTSRTGNLVLGTGSIERMRIFSNGNIGVGTPTDAGYKLDVNGTVRAGTVTSQSGALISARNTGNSFEFGHSNQAGYGSVLGANSGNGFSFLAFNAEAGTTNNTFRTRGLNGRIIINDINNNRLQFQRTTSSSADNQTPVIDMTIDGSGNMGIGTVAPVYKLHIKGVSNFGIKSEAPSSDAGIYLGHNGSVADIASSYESTAGFFPLTFTTNGTERVRINTNGNVGIGTAAPSYKLDISGSGIVTQRIVSTDNQANFSLQGTFGQLNNEVGDFYINNNSASGPMIFRVGSTVERMRITSTGNVGIGTNAPDEKLEVFNGNYTNLKISANQQSSIKLNTTTLYGVNNPNAELYNNYGNVGLTLYPTPTATRNDIIYYDNTDKETQFQTDGSTKLRIRGNGNVLIGTPTDAGYKLDVNGSARATRFEASSTTAITLTNNGNQDFHSSGASAKIRFIDSGYANENLTIDQSGNTYIRGNLGVGTISPTQKLDINGNIKAFSVSGGGAYYSSTTATDAAARNWVMRGNSVVYGDFDIRQSNALNGDPIAAGNSRFYINPNGNVGIGTTTPNASSVLDITSTTKGVLFPRMTTTEISAIASPADGLTVYNTTLKAICFYDSSAAVWKRVSHSNM